MPRGSVGGDSMVVFPRRPWLFVVVLLKVNVSIVPYEMS